VGISGIGEMVFEVRLGPCCNDLGRTFEFEGLVKLMRTHFLKSPVRAVL
jgi:hypothetical protein